MNRDKKLMFDSSAGEKRPECPAKPGAQAKTMFEAAARNASPASESAADRADDKADEVLSEQQFRANVEAN
jgi:cell division septum initiation protein DivIVA